MTSCSSCLGSTKIWMDVGLCPSYYVRLDGENKGLDKGNMFKIDGYQNLFGLMKQRLVSFKN